MNSHKEYQGICGFFWRTGVSPDRIENHEAERHVSISERQWWMLAALMQRCVEDTEAPNPATPHGSWLEGFQMGLRASDAQIAQGPEPLIPSHHARAGSKMEKPDTVAQHENHPAVLKASQSVSHQDKTTSGSSSGCADGESTGELPTLNRRNENAPARIGRTRWSRNSFWAWF